MRRKAVLVAAALGFSIAASGGTAVAATSTHVAPQAATPTAAKTAAAANNALPGLGVHVHGMWEKYWNGQTPNTMLRTHLDRLASNNVEVVRVDMGWSAGQPTKAAPSAGSWHNRRLNTLINEVRKRGMKIFLTIHQSPNWARPGTGNNAKQFPKDSNSIKPYMTFVSKTYGSRLLGIEVWNEPNLEEFTGVANAGQRTDRYVRLLKASYAAIKAGNRNTTVVFGGTAQTDDGFIRDTYRKGAKGAFDVMAVHPYQGNQMKAPESMDITGKSRMTNMPAVIQVMKQYGDGHKPIWWTEFGTSVHSNAGVREIWRLGVPTEQMAGDYMVRSFKLAQREYPQVKLGTIYVAYKEKSDSYGHQYGYRLLDANGKVHKQLTMLKDMRKTAPSRLGAAAARR